MEVYTENNGPSLQRLRSLRQSKDSVPDRACAFRVRRHTHAPPLCTLLCTYWPDLGGPHQQCLWFLLGLRIRAPAGDWEEEGEWVRLFAFLPRFDFTVAGLRPSPIALLSQQLSSVFWSFSRRFRSGVITALSLHSPSWSPYSAAHSFETNPPLNS